MQLITDNAADLTPQQLDALPIEIHRTSLTLTLDGKTYVSGVDVQPEEFYQLMNSTDGMPTTSQPAPGDMVELFRSVAEKTGDKDLLAVLISSGLSGTPNSARLAAQQVEAEGIHVKLIDSKTLSAPEGWQVEAAARAIAAGWSFEQIRDLLSKIQQVADACFTLPTLKYLIHGGRISHLQGLVASTIGIKPIIGVTKDGKYDTWARVRTFKKAVTNIADVIEKSHPAGTKLRVQPLHAVNPDALERMKAAIAKKFDVEWVPDVPIAPVLGAHTGEGLVGCAFAPVDKYPELP